MPPVNSSSLSSRQACAGVPGANPLILPTALRDPRPRPHVSRRGRFFGPNHVSDRIGMVDNGGDDLLFKRINFARRSSQLSNLCTTRGGTLPCASMKSN
jgi:hypothetical protein